MDQLPAIRWDTLVQFPHSTRMSPESHGKIKRHCGRFFIVTFRWLFSGFLRMTEWDSPMADFWSVGNVEKPSARLRYPWAGSRSSSPCRSGPHTARPRLNHLGAHSGSGTTYGSHWFLRINHINYPMLTSLDLYTCVSKWCLWSDFLKTVSQTQGLIIFGSKTPAIFESHQQPDFRKDPRIPGAVIQELKHASLHLWEELLVLPYQVSLLWMGKCGSNCHKWWY